MTVEQIKEMAGRLLANPGDLLLIAAGDFDMVSTVLGELRQEIGSRLNLPEVDRFAFAFVVDFPLLFRTGEHGRWQPMHHPFTAPKDKDASLLESAPEKVGGKHYDVVLNGYEIGGGSIRIHQSELQRQIFRLLGYADEEVNELFGHLLEAFDYGAPPHGGIALGLDRLAMLLAGEETIREVIAFPKNQAAVDMALDAPSPVTEEQLTELHLNLSDE
jgi:aspartyl-tRNA synthetase